MKQAHFYRRVLGWVKSVSVYLVRKSFFCKVINGRAKIIRSLFMDTVSQSGDCWLGGAYLYADRLISHSRLI